MVAHAGGVLPYLAARLDACVIGDAASPVKLRHEPSSYLRLMYFDAIAYQAPALSLLLSLVGASRVMFGTDHPFFPPHVSNPSLDTQEWHSPAVHRAVLGTFGGAVETAILHANAMAAFGVPLPG